MTTIKILLVEDEECLREMLLDLLVEDGFETIPASSGDAAATLLSAYDLQLLLTDINMPGRLDGVGLAQHARASCPGLPVIFITGRPEMRTRALSVGGPSTVLAKPFRFAELLKTVRHMVSIH